MDHARPIGSSPWPLLPLVSRRLLVRARALFGGAAFLGAVGLWHAPPASWPIVTADARSQCETAGAGELCKAVAGLSKLLDQPTASLHGVDRLPPPGVPGAIDPSVTQGNIDTTVCRPGYSRSVRRPYAVTGPLKRQMMAEQRPGEPMADYELDHLIPISLGGAPLDARNLWLQPRRGQANAGDKNELAYVLWRLVCDRRVTLATAQRSISQDWIKAYATYATPKNVEKYHFRGVERREE